MRPLFQGARAGRRAGKVSMDMTSHLPTKPATSSACRQSSIAPLCSSELILRIRDGERTVTFGYWVPKPASLLPCDKHPDAALAERASGFGYVSHHDDHPEIVAFREVSRQRVLCRKDQCRPMHELAAEARIGSGGRSSVSRLWPDAAVVARLPKAEETPGAGLSSQTWDGQTPSAL